MLVRFFFLLRDAGIPVTIGEFLTLLEALQAGLAAANAERFYFLSRTCLVKDECHYDRFDRAFAAHFEGAANFLAVALHELPPDWLKKMTEKNLSEAEKADIRALGGWDLLMSTLRQRLLEQQGRHEGGNRWIGTAGTSPAPMDTTPRACASARKNRAIEAR
jgi:uncharacterized protein with von Willebrand factor type A (vWA) domain